MDFLSQLIKSENAVDSKRVALVAFRKGRSVLVTRSVQDKIFRSISGKKLNI